MLNIVSVTELKQNTAKVLDQVKADGKPTVIMQRSKAKAILLDPGYYEALEEAMEQIEDVKDLDKRRAESGVPFDEYFKKRFGKQTAQMK